MDLRKYHGKKFSAVIHDRPVEGKICVEEHPYHECDCVYLCQNVMYGDQPVSGNLFGYSTAWSNGTHSEMLIRTGKNLQDGVENFRILNKRVTYDDKGKS